MGQTEALIKHLKDIKKIHKQDLLWLSSRGIDATGLSYKEIEESVYAECRKILLEEWGWYQTTSVIVAKSYPRENGTRKIYRAGSRGKKSDKCLLYARYYDPNSGNLYAANQAYTMIQENIRHIEKKSLLGISKLMTDSVDGASVVLGNEDIVAFIWLGKRMGEEATLGYLGKINFDTFKENERYYTAQCIKKARNEFLY